MRKSLSNTLLYILTGGWLLTTVALSIWWLIFNFRQIDKINSLNLEPTSEIARHQRMLVMEGTFLVMLLLIGGMALFYAITKERSRRQAIQEFFATFTHELKTSLASLRLQAESLQEDLGSDPAHQKLVQRLSQDTVRLEVQLENSLYLAHGRSDQLFIEKNQLSKHLSVYRHQWPQLQIEMKKDAVVFADSRCLESIFKNLIQNSVAHGKATLVKIDAEKGLGSKIKILISDNGQGFKGESSRLGKLFTRHNKSSGSGVGLYLVKELVHKMDGEARFLTENGHFATELILEGELI